MCVFFNLKCWLRLMWCFRLYWINSWGVTPHSSSIPCIAIVTSLLFHSYSNQICVFHCFHICLSYWQYKYIYTWIISPHDCDIMLHATIQNVLYLLKYTTAKRYWVTVQALNVLHNITDHPIEIDWGVGTTFEILYCHGIYTFVFDAIQIHTLSQ